MAAEVKAAEAQAAAGYAQRSLKSLSNLGLCEWETVVELHEESIKSRSVTKTTKGSPRRTRFIQNAMNAEAVLGLSIEVMEDRGDGAAGPSPGQLVVEAVVPEFFKPIESVAWFKCA
jgi:hypothetical protein